MTSCSERLLQVNLYIRHGSKIRSLQSRLKGSAPDFMKPKTPIPNLIYTYPIVSYAWTSIESTGTENVTLEFEENASDPKLKYPKKSDSAG